MPRQYENYFDLVELIRTRSARRHHPEYYWLPMNIRTPMDTATGMASGVRNQLKTSGGGPIRRKRQSTQLRAKPYNINDRRCSVVAAQSDPNRRRRTSNLSARRPLSQRCRASQSAAVKRRRRSNLTNNNTSASIVFSRSRLPFQGSLPSANRNASQQRSPLYGNISHEPFAQPRPSNYPSTVTNIRTSTSRSTLTTSAATTNIVSPQQNQMVGGVLEASKYNIQHSSQVVGGSAKTTRSNIQPSSQVIEMGKHVQNTTYRLPSAVDTPNLNTDYHNEQGGYRCCVDSVYSFSSEGSYQMRSGFICPSCANKISELRYPGQNSFQTFKSNNAMQQSSSAVMPENVQANLIDEQQCTVTHAQLGNVPEFSNARPPTTDPQSKMNLSGSLKIQTDDESADEAAHSINSVTSSAMSASVSREFPTALIETVDQSLLSDNMIVMFMRMERNNSERH